MCIIFHRGRISAINRYDVLVSRRTRHKTDAPQGKALLSRRSGKQPFRRLFGCYATSHSFESPFFLHNNNPLPNMARGYCGAPSGTRRSVAPVPQNSPLDCFLAFGKHATYGCWLLIRVPLPVICKKGSNQKITSFFGAPSGTRTPDTVIKSHVLYHLS